MPTSFDPPIKKMRVEAFRGFRDPRRFDLDASAIMVTGPNGTGKTSFFDAMQWCLLGSVRRLEVLRARKNVEHLVNQYRIGSPASVEMDLVIEGTEVTIRRAGDHSGSTLELRRATGESVFGEEAERLLRDLLVAEGEISLELALTTSGLMQQDVMRSVLESKPSDRYRHLSTVLGLAGLEEFEEATRQLAKDAKSRADGARSERDAAALSAQSARQRVAAAEERLRTLPRLESLRAEILQSAAGDDGLPSVRVSNEDLQDAPGVRHLSTELGTVLDALEDVLTAARALETVPSPLKGKPEESSDGKLAERIETAEALVDRNNQALVVAKARFDAASSASEDFVKLAALAIPMLGSHCPVCSQAIDSDHVEATLRARAQETGILVEIQTEVDKASVDLELSQLGLEELHSERRALESLRTLWSRYESAEARLSDAWAALKNLSGLVNIPDSVPSIPIDLTNSLTDRVKSTRRRVLELLDSLERGPDQGALMRAASEAAGLDEVLKARETRLEEESLRAKQLKLLSDSAIDSRVEITNQRFQAVQPLVANIFNRLDPHPAFKTIEFELDTYYGRGTTSPMVRDLVEGVAADPLVIFFHFAGEHRCSFLFPCNGHLLWAEGLAVRTAR